MPFTDTPLYGGAITVDLPSGTHTNHLYSQIRQVPDHQEVYLDAEGYSSIVVEILEYVNKPSDEEALQYHFADLVDGTGDATTLVNQGRAQIKNNPVLSLTFIQTPQNPNPRRKEPEFAYIHLLLLRLKEQGTDILVTINIPHYRGEYEKPIQEGQETKLMKDSAVVKEKVLESFQIKDWNLFQG
ncbi:Mog1p/PsbP-like protein [Pyrenochaeta sp. DS3sAY3a]|nr:Mog1p/PsbP-like protein [Pyrenochaeta sp. DS3sAY3a]